MAASNALAAGFRALHVPGKPVILANVYDILSARAVAALPSCKALATSSGAIALANGTKDYDMDQATHLKAIISIAKVAAEYRKPLSVDIQDGYNNLEEVIKRLIQEGVHGVNIEDCGKETRKMYPLEEAVSRIKTVLKVAKGEGVPDFVVNARCDTLPQGGLMEEVVKRGKAYLDAGATTVFVVSGKSGLNREDIEGLVHEFGGRLNVVTKLSASDGLDVKGLSQLGVARISIAPQLLFKATETITKEAEKLFDSGQLEESYKYEAEGPLTLRYQNNIMSFLEVLPRIGQDAPSVMKGQFSSIRRAPAILFCASAVTHRCPLCKP